MNKEEIKSRIVELEQEVNSIISKAMMLSREQIHNLDLAYAEMERLQFKLQEMDDGPK